MWQRLCTLSRHFTFHFLHCEKSRIILIKERKRKLLKEERKENAHTISGTLGIFHGNCIPSTASPTKQSLFARSWCYGTVWQCLSAKHKHYAMIAKLMICCEFLNFHKLLFLYRSGFITQPFQSGLIMKTWHLCFAIIFWQMHWWARHWNRATSICPCSLMLC